MIEIRTNMVLLGSSKSFLAFTTTANTKIKEYGVKDRQQKGAILEMSNMELHVCII